MKDNKNNNTRDSPPALPAELSIVIVATRVQKAISCEKNGVVETGRYLSEEKKEEERGNDE